jgi:hypothetical protein
MRVSRPVAPVDHAAADPFAAAAGVSDGGRSAMRALVSAADVGGPRLASGPGSPRVTAATSGVKAASGTRAGRIELAGLASVSPLHRPTVTGANAGASQAGNHVGGAMLPPPANTVSLSDGTRISFGAVAEVAELEDA